MMAQVSGSQSTAERTSALRSGTNGCRRRNVPVSGIYSSFTLQSPFPKLQRYSSSNLRKIGLDQRPKLWRDLGALSEPQFEPAHRLVQQHAQPIGGLQSARPPC